MVLPGESISKYSRADGEAPAPAPAADDRQPAKSPIVAIAAGVTVIEEIVAGVDGVVTGIVAVAANANRANRARRRALLCRRTTLRFVLPGESISKYRGAEPLVVPPVVPDVVSDQVEASAPVAPVEPASERGAEQNPDEPLSSASYSGASKLPSLTQRFAPEVEETEAESAVQPIEDSAPQETAEASPAEPAGEELAEGIPSAVTPQADARREEAPAEALPGEAEAGAPEESAKSKGRAPLLARPGCEDFQCSPGRSCFPAGEHAAGRDAGSRVCGRRIADPRRVCDQRGGRSRTSVL